MGSHLSINPLALVLGPVANQRRPFRPFCLSSPPLPASHEVPSRRSLYCLPPCHPSASSAQHQVWLRLHADQLFWWRLRRRDLRPGQAQADRCVQRVPGHRRPRAARGRRRQEYSDPHRWYDCDLQGAKHPRRQLRRHRPLHRAALRHRRLGDDLDCLCGRLCPVAVAYGRRVPAEGAGFRSGCGACCRLAAVVRCMIPRCLVADVRRCSMQFHTLFILCADHPFCYSVART